MESPTRTPGSQILGRSSMFRFFGNLVGSKGSPKGCDQALVGHQQCPSNEQAAVSLMTGPCGEVGRKDPRLLSRVPHILSVALPQHNILGLGAQIPIPTEVLNVMAPDLEVRSILPRGYQEILGNLSEKEEREEKEEASGEVAKDTGTSDRGHFAQALEVEQRATGPLEASSEAFPWEEEEEEEEEECLLVGDLGLASLKAEATTWSHLLTLYKQLQKLAIAKFPIKEGLPHKEEDTEEEMEEEDSSFKLCVPGIGTLQSSLHKTLRSTDLVGGDDTHTQAFRREPMESFMESELKKLLVVQQESCVWKTGGHEDWEPLTHPEITLEEAGIVDGQPLLLEEMDESGNWPPE